MKKGLVWLLPLAVFLVTQNRYVGVMRIVFVLIGVLWLVLEKILLQRRWKSEYRLVISFVVSGLLLIGMTHWVSSPFFYMSYLLILLVSGMLGVLEGVGFGIVMSGLLFLPLIGIDGGYKGVVILGYVLVLAIGIFVNRKYRRLVFMAKKAEGFEEILKESGVSHSVVEERLKIISKLDIKSLLVHLKSVVKQAQSKGLRVDKRNIYLREVFTKMNNTLKEVNKITKRPVDKLSKSEIKKATFFRGR